MNYNKVAEDLDSASLNATAVPQVSLTDPLNLDQAYAIQSISLGRRYQRGEKWVGLKMGFTSKAKMEQMGVHDLIWGRLTNKMFYKTGSDLPFNKFIHPRAEPEIAFLLSKDIDQVLTLDNVAEYVAGVTIAIEIIDSRFQNFKFSLEDVIADNCSSAAFTVGEWQDVGSVIQDINISLSVDGEVVHAGNSNAILGNPWESLISAARLAKDNGEVLTKDAIVLAGAATPAVYIAAGQKIEAKGDGLGTATLMVV